MTTLLTESLSAATVLEAVNVMLQGIGEPATVTLLSDDISVDVESAHKTLNAISLDIQALGWHFNKTLGLRIQHDPATGYVRLPDNTLRVDEVRTESWRLGSDVVMRGLRLYDRRLATFVLDRDVTVDLVEMLPFEDLPQYARTYITIKAARKFAQDETASDVVSRFALRDEEEAFANMERLDNQHEDPSLKAHSPFLAGMIRR